MYIDLVIATKHVKGFVNIICPGIKKQINK